MRGVERDEVAGARAPLDEGAPARGGAEALDEVLADRRAREPAFVFHRDQGERRRQRLGEEPAADRCGRVFDVVHRNA